MMPTPFQTSVDNQECPVVVENVAEFVTPTRFIPSARLMLTPALRTSGLLASLTDEGARTLLAVLSFVTPNGRIRPAVSDVAVALGIPEVKVRQRLLRLSKTTWQDQPLVLLIDHESGLETVTLSPVLVRIEETVKPPENEGESVPLPLPPSTPLPGRSLGAEVIAFSRATYGRPRAEVEREVLAQLGHSPEETEDSPEGEVRRRLLGLGVSQEEVDALMMEPGLAEVQRQLEWLPYRHARSPARYIVAAIRGSYDPPPTLSESSEAE